MKLDIFENKDTLVGGQLLTADGFNEVVFSPEVEKLCSYLGVGDTEEEELLPHITWAAHFAKGDREKDEPVPSGLFPLLVEDLENARKTWNAIVGRHKELGIVLAFTDPTCRKLLLVAQCRKEFPQVKAVEINQHWLADQIGCGKPVIDGDPRRGYPIYTHNYLLFQSGNIFEIGEQLSYMVGHEDPQRSFKGIPLTEIAKAWIEANVGEPAQGQYTNLIYNLAYRMRHICEYQPTVIAQAVPHFNLSDEAVMKECTKACSAARSSMPTDLQDVIDRLEAQRGEEDNDDPVKFEADAQESLAQFIDSTQMPPLPPVIKQYVDTAPEGFEAAAALCTLPILGTVGSRLRAHYITRHNLAPTFMVCLIGEQSSGKSFITDAAELFLADVQRADDAAEDEYKEYRKTMKKISATKAKVTKKDMDTVIPDEPTPIMRIIEPKVTQPALLKIMVNNENLHCITVAPEIDTVRKSLSTNHGNISDFLRQAFDNVRYGQQTACDTSFSGHVIVYYNTLYSGTPVAVKKFFNQETQENGLMSRFIMVTLPYDPYAERGIWKEFTPAQRRVVEQGLRALDSITVRSYTLPDKDGVEHEHYEAMPEHQMELPWLNKYLADWSTTLRDKARKAQSESHAKFHLRCAVEGFRAGMLAYYLYGEKRSAKVKKAVCEFAVWVANSMLNGLVDNYDESEERTKGFYFHQIYNVLPDEFTRDQLQEALRKFRLNTPVSKVLNMWRKAQVIDPTQRYTSAKFNKKF